MPDGQPESETDERGAPQRTVTGYGIGSAVLAVGAVAAVVLSVMIWTGHRGETDERAYRTRVLQAAADWIDAQVRRIAAAPPFEGLTLDLHGGFTRAPKPMDAAQTALFEAVRQAGALLGQPIAWKPSGGVCEGNNLHAAGLPNIDTLGVRGGDIHSDQEFAWPDSFVERAQLSALILCKVASGDIDAAKLKSLRMETP